MGSREVSSSAYCDCHDLGDFGNSGGLHLSLTIFHLLCQVNLDPEQNVKGSRAVLYSADLCGMIY